MTNTNVKCSTRTSATNGENWSVLGRNHFPIDVKDTCPPPTSHNYREQITAIWFCPTDSGSVHCAYTSRPKTTNEILWLVGTHCAYSRKKSQAELTWVAGSCLVLSSTSTPGPWSCALHEFLFQAVSFTCPKYTSFLSLTDASKLLCTSAVLSTHSFFFAVHETTCLRHFISKALIFALSGFLRVQLSHPYIATGQTSAFRSRILWIWK